MSPGVRVWWRAPVRIIAWMTFTRWRDPRPLRERQCDAVVPAVVGVVSLVGMTVGPSGFAWPVGRPM